jgi:ABC-type hemin transport system ATPase subunit
MQIITVEERKNVLLMDEGGAQALDLNHCTHIFLLEPILDQGEENEVLSYFL